MFPFIINDSMVQGIPWKSDGPRTYGNRKVITVFHKQPATGTYTKQVESSPHLHTLLL